MGHGKEETDMRCDRQSMLLYAVTDRAWTGPESSLKEQVEAALKGGVTCVQLREKELNEEEFLREAVELKALCGDYKVPFIVNDNVEVALKCGADGVHVGQEDMQAADVRALAGEHCIIGVTAKTVEQALAAEKAGADYLGVGAVFSSPTKPNAKGITHQMLKEICGAVSIPVVAIGGINKENMMELAGSGADGVALVSAVFAAEDIEAECRELRSMAEKMVLAGTNDRKRS